MKEQIVKTFIIGVFTLLYVATSLISTVHVIDFFELSNPTWMAISLAIAFEIGAAASLASIITLEKMNKTLIWSLFIAITLMQVQGNLYYAFKNAHDFGTWVELFNLVEEEPLYQKRVLSFVSGAILPLVALGFIKSLVDYIKPDKSEKKTELRSEEPSKIEEPVKSIEPTPSREDNPYVSDEIEPETEIEEAVESSEIIKTERDFNEFLKNTNNGGLVNQQPRPRVVGDDNRPTGFEHPSVIKKKND